MPRDLQMLLLNVAFLTLLMQRLLGQQTTKTWASEAWCRGDVLPLDFETFSKRRLFSYF